jgi:hypothetical protein
VHVQLAQEDRSGIFQTAGDLGTFRRDAVFE